VNFEINPFLNFGPI